MSDAQLNFKVSIENLEKLNIEYIQPNKGILQLRSQMQIQFSTQNVASGVLATTISGTAPMVINDHIRMCHIYCIMLWTYWSALQITTPVLEELMLIRNCLVHHEGDMFRYSQAPGLFGKQGATLIKLTTGKSYVQGYNLSISDTDLVSFTDLVKLEFKDKTGFII